MKKGVGWTCIHYAVELPKGTAGGCFKDWIGGYFERYGRSMPLSENSTHLSGITRIPWQAAWKLRPTRKIDRPVAPPRIQNGQSSFQERRASMSSETAADFDDRWRNWVVTNLTRKCTHDSIIAVMVHDGFEKTFADRMVKTIAMELQRGVTLAAPPPSTAVDRAAPSSAVKAQTDSGYAQEPSRIVNANAIGTLDRVVRVASRWTRPDVVLLAEVLSGEECRELIELARPKMAQSTVVDRGILMASYIVRGPVRGLFSRCARTTWSPALTNGLRLLSDGPSPTAKDCKYFAIRWGASIVRISIIFPRRMPPARRTSPRAASGSGRSSSISMMSRTGAKRSFRKSACRSFRVEAMPSISATAILAARSIL